MISGSSYQNYKTQAPAMASTDVGGMLVKRRQQQAMLGGGMGMPPEGMEPMAEEMGETPGQEMAEMPPRGDPSAMTAAPMAEAPNATLPDGDSAYDPAQEHSASASRVALDEAIQRMMGVPQIQNRRVVPKDAGRLSQLGLPPSEVALLQKSGGMG